MVKFTVYKADDRSICLKYEIWPFFELPFAWGLMLLERSLGASMTNCADVIDRSWINSDLLRSWKQICDGRNHVNCQRGPDSARLTTICPNWLIDTWRMCLVKGIPGAPYVALSYVWGNEPFFKTNLHNVAQLQKDFALTDAHRMLGVPRTITDAIETVSLLEHRYLWVDALCIVQDDTVTKHVEMNNMAAIYDVASITIIDMQGHNANYGLRGLRNISQPRSFTQQVFRPAKGYDIVHTQKKSGVGSPWSRRGWTYQEGLFSRRRLEFVEDGVQWQCACALFYEEFQANVCSLQPEYTRKRGSGVFWMPFPSLISYSELLRNYNTRDFTYPEDALPAFSGITTALSRTFPGGFICGLPLMFLDVALCWQPSKKGCERRVPSEKREATELSLPSWSWIGWKCEPSPWAWDHGGDYVKRSPFVRKAHSTQQTISIVRWFSQKWGNTKKKPIHRVQSTMQELKMIAVQERDELPVGWLRFDYIADSRDKNESNDSAWGRLMAPRYFYKLECDTQSEFWYPIPTVQDINKEPSSQMNGNDTLLSGHTTRAWFYGKGRLGGYHTAVSLWDNLDNWVGALRLQIKSLDDTSTDPGTCELVAISAGYAIEGFPAYAIDEWEIKQRPKGSPGKKYEYYNVLWVEWKDGVAYRKASGRVMKSAWEAQDLEEVDLVLG